MDLQFEHRLTETESRSKSNTHRIAEMKQRMDRQDERIDAVNRLASAVEVLATKQESIAENVDKLAGKVECIESEPAKKWRFVVEKSIYFIVGGVMAYLLGQVGL